MLKNLVKLWMLSVAALSGVTSFGYDRVGEVPARTGAIECTEQNVQDTVREIDASERDATARRARS